MSLKRRIGKLEKAVGVEDPVQGAVNLVRFSIDYGILPPDIDFEEEVRKCAKAGLSLSKIIREIIQEIHARSNGLPQLPCYREDS